MHASYRLGTRAFVIGGFILFGVGLFFVSNRDRLFNRNFEVYTEFDRLDGLEKGAKVRVSGMNAGEVLDTEVPKRPDGRFRLKLRIEENLHAFVRMDSVAEIRTMGLAGDSYLDIQKGTPRAPESASGATIPSREPLDTEDLMQQGSDLMKTTQTSINDLRARSDRTLESVNSVAQHTDQIVVAIRPELQAMLASARRTADSMNEIVAQLQQGHGTIGELLTDQKLADSVRRTIENARQSTLNLNNASARMNDTMADFQRRDLLGRAEAVLENTRRIMEQLNQTLVTFTSSQPGDENAAANLRDAIAGARTSMNNLAADTEALRHNLFLRGFFKRRGYFNLDRMTPAEYRSSKFLDGRSSKRIWLSTEELFASAPGDKLELTQEGQWRVDDAMSALVPYLPNSPMVVEGYATQGSTGEQFIQAKRRASLVQIYIEKRFGLQADMVAVMPMSGPIPPSVGKSAWNGVSLVVLR